MEFTPQHLNQALHEAESWMNLQGIEGVALGESGGKPCIIVWHSLPAQNYSESIPATVNGVPVLMQESSVIQAQDGEISIL